MALASPTLFRPDSIPTNLQGYWKGDEASGTRADSSGNGNTLTDNNTVTTHPRDYWRTGEVAMKFTAANSESVSITDASQTGLDISGSVTISAFVRFDSIVSQGLVGKGSVSNYLLGMNSSGFIEFGVGGAQATGTTALLANKWYHVAGVYDSTNQFLMVYVDGNLAKIIAHSTNPTPDANDFLIGDNFSYTNFFNGQMKDVAIWSVALTPLQIKSLAMGVDLSERAVRPSDIQSANLQLYLKLNDYSDGASGATWVDSSGNGNDFADPSGSRVANTGGFIEGVGATFVGNPHGSVFDYLFDATAGQTGLSFDGAEQSMSISFWIKWTSNADSTDALIHRFNSSTDGWFVTCGAATGNLGFSIYRGGSSTSCSASAALKAGTWCHVVCRYNASTNYQEIWVDGVMVDQQTQTHGVGSGGTNMYIGTNGTTTGNDFFTGDLCDIAVWDSALTDDEIVKLAKGFDMSLYALASAFRLDEASGTRADAHGSNTLTDNNTVTQGTGKVDDAASFDDANSEYLSLPDGSQNPSIENDSSDIDGYTIFGGCYPHDVTGSNTVWCKGSTLVATGGYSCYLDGVNNFIIYSDGLTTSDPENPVANTWHWLGQVSDGAKDYIYKDSFNYASSANGLGSGNADDFRIGASGAGDYFDGEIDEVVIFKRALRPEEMKVCYNRFNIGVQFNNRASGNATQNAGFFMAAA